MDPIGTNEDVRFGCGAVGKVEGYGAVGVRVGVGAVRVRGGGERRGGGREREEGVGD